MQDGASSSLPTSLLSPGPGQGVLGPSHGHGCARAQHEHRDSAEAITEPRVLQRAEASPELLRSDLSSKNIQLSAWLRAHLFTP